MSEDQKNGNQVRWRSGHLPPGKLNPPSMMFEKEYNTPISEKSVNKLTEFLYIVLYFILGFAILLFFLTAYLELTG